MNNDDKSRLLGIAVSDLLKNYDSKMIVINVDDMDVALMSVTGEGDCIVEKRWHDDKFNMPNFYKAASARLGTYSDRDIYEFCKESKKTFERYIKLEGSLELQPEVKSHIEDLMQIYDENYKQTVVGLINEAQSMYGEEEELSIVLVGAFSAFYLVEYTVKKEITPMVFQPLGMLKVIEGLSVPIEVLVDNAKAAIENIEKNKKRIREDVRVVFYGRSPQNTEKLNPYMPPKLAEKGSDFESLKSPKYSDVIMAHKDEPIVLMAASEQYRLVFPESIFANGNTITKVQFAIGLRDNVPKLLVKSGNQEITIDIDSKIYSEG